MVVQALRLGADVGLGAIIEQSGDETPDDVFQALVVGNAQLWSIAVDGRPAGTMITQIERRPATMVLVVRYLAGKRMETWAGQATKELQIFARKVGCDAIEATGREGLRKHLLSIGWSKVAVLYRVPADG